MGVLSWWVRTLGELVAGNSLRVAGGVAAVGGVTVTTLAVGVGATSAEVLEFALDHYAYTVAVVVGLAVLVLPR